ncbi:MAG: glycosyltransferase [Bryobacterales bacterium]|nr:glycosyltransferase [Bryobacterales bacterium]MBV9401973.1 glycosyltransferase [Bryobacterales bacterium]
MSPTALFLSPEPPTPGSGGGGLRSASLLQYLRSKYSVDVVGFSLRPHSKSTPARLWRNLRRFARGVPPLFDRYSGYEAQLRDRIRSHKYALGIVEHFWCASYEPLLRTCCERVVLDLHNIESALAESHARAARWPASLASARFAKAYLQLEKEWLPRFDAVLVASEEDRCRIDHKVVIVYPNALPEIARPDVPEENCIVFSGNLEYHPNIEAVRWFRNNVWPQLSGVEWRLVGRNPEAVSHFVRGNSRIRIVGPVDDAATELARAKVCIVPLLSGSGTRFKILEAWAAARAVVSTSIGAEGLCARDGEQLLIADDPEAFAAAIARLLAQPELRARLGSAGRAWYLDNFTWPVAWRRLEAAGI